MSVPGGKGGVSPEPPRLEIALPADLVDAIARRASELVLEQLGMAEPASPWLDTKGAAAYLSWPTERVYKCVHELPHFRHGNRLLFRRDELDRYLERCRERRP